MVRLSYRYEMRSALTFPLAASLAEGSFTGVVAAKNFNASVILMSLITAAPMFGNIMALLWSELSRGRAKVPLVNLLQGGVIAMIASVPLCALLPPDAAGWIFAAQIIVARVLASGIITIRSGIWRANYPRQFRGQLISRIAVVATAVLAVTTFVGSYLLDQNPMAYVYVYPVAAGVGLVGIWQFSHIRVRREISLRRREEQLYAPRPENVAQTGGESNVLNYMPGDAAQRRWHRFFGQAFELLREDRDFRDYQRWMFFSGSAFMMFVPSLLYMVSTEMTPRSQDYLLATLVVQIIPMITTLLCAQLWAPLFDRVHITRFRVAQSFVSLAAIATLYAGALYGQWTGDNTTALALIALGQVLMGVTTAAGNLAWNLGHNDFARAEQASTYMGVHVMLTGLRGCLAPFIGAWLYQTPGVGRNIFGLSLILCVIASLGFWSMSRRAPAKPLPKKPGALKPIKA